VSWRAWQYITQYSAINIFDYSDNSGSLRRPQAGYAWVACAGNERALHGREV
jgi:hypothetical protein